MCDHVATEFEKEERRDYTFSIALFRMLLELPFPFLRHRRGRWLDRMALDLTHTGRPTEALTLVDGMLMERDIKVGAAATHVPPPISAPSQIELQGRELS